MTRAQQEHRFECLLREFPNATEEDKRNAKICLLIALDMRQGLNRAIESARAVLSRKSAPESEG